MEIYSTVPCGYCGAHSCPSMHPRGDFCPAFESDQYTDMIEVVEEEIELEAFLTERILERVRA